MAPAAAGSVQSPRIPGRPKALVKFDCSHDNRGTVYSCPPRPLSAEAPRSRGSAECASQELRKLLKQNHLRGRARILMEIRIWPNQRPLRPEGSGSGSQGVDSKQLTASRNSACPQSCPNYRQAEATQDNSGHDGDMLLRSLLRAVQDGDDGNGGKQPRKSRTKGRGESLLEVIRLLVEMNPEERTALVELLQALG